MLCNVTKVVTQGLPAVGATTMCKHVVDRIEEKWSSVNIMKKDGAGDSRVENSSLL